MKVLVTGGAGYIGSHTCVELLNAGFDVVVFDNLSNSSEVALKRVESITDKAINFINGDIRNGQQLNDVFLENKIDAVIHFAGLKSVAESIKTPLDYYDVNVAGSLMLLEVMEAHACHCLVFSSSATVYGEKAIIPYTESQPLAAYNTYGRTKLMVEQVLKDLYTKPDSQWRFGLLRYFNPVGAHPSGLIGEDPKGIPNNLLPYIAQVAVGKLDCLHVFGDDYPTVDGTGVRDYIHVMDLARGHVSALRYLLKADSCCRAYNLGSGKGYSVLQMLVAFEKASRQKIDYKICPRRQGDLAEYYADASLAYKDLDWKTELSLSDMVADAWCWQSNNPQGYC